MKYEIRDLTVIGGDKESTPLGVVEFKRIHVTEDEKIAQYFKNKKSSYRVTELPED